MLKKKIFGKDSKIVIFVVPANFTYYLMKSKQFHQLIVRNGWRLIRVSGSHYIYRKEGFRDMPVPYHGSKEMGPGLERALRKEMKLK